MSTENNTSPIYNGPNGYPTYSRGKKIPAWFLIGLPFLIAIWIALYKHAVKNIHWKSAWMTVLLFEVTCLYVEHTALIRGFWVYNENKIFGPRIWDVPIEEVFVYYIWPIVMVVMVFTAFRNAAIEGIPPWKAPFYLLQKIFRKLQDELK